MKTASVYARIDENLKSDAESVFERLGIPVSVAINMFYSQVVLRQGIPFPLSAVPRPVSFEEMTSAQFEQKLNASILSAQNGQGRAAVDVFSDLEREFGL